MPQIATSRTGDGPAALLLHGLNGFAEGWGGLPDALSGAGMRVVTADLTGAGAGRRRRTTPQGIAAGLGPLVERLAPVRVVGHSLGAQVALLLAVERPTQVGRLALIAPWVLGRPPRIPPRSLSDLIQLPVVGRPLARALIARARRDPERRRQAWLGTIAHPERALGDPAMAELLRMASDRLRDADLRAMVDWAASGMALDVRAFAPRVAQPTLIVQGDLDGVTPRAGATRLLSLLPAGRLLSVSDVGHFPHLEAAATVLPALVEHLR